MLNSTLIENNLKVTPQRLAVLDAMNKLKGHPTAEAIIEQVRKHHPNVAIGTIYNALDTFVSKGIVLKVKTDKDYNRYELVNDNHHHLYCLETERIEDYFDVELNAMLNEYFAKKSIPNFRIDEIKLQLTGRFMK